METLTLEVNLENHKALLALLKDAVIENARGYDAKDRRLSGSPNQMNILSMYSDIDLDANGIKLEFQAAMEELLWFVNKHLANTGKGSFDGAKVTVIFDRDVLINENGVIANCKNAVGILSNEILVKMHAWVLDPEEKLKRLKAKKEEEAAADPYRAAFGKTRGGGAGAAGGRPILRGVRYGGEHGGKDGGVRGVHAESRGADYGEIHLCQHRGQSHAERERDRGEVR